jgi:phage tail sheath protein FI
MAVVPGITDQRVQNALISLAESSQNFLAAVAPPQGLDTVQEAIDWMNGKGDGRTAAINSSWGSVFWPWVQVFDVFSAKDRWYDPAIFAIRQMAFTDNVAETWFAPAGFRRGRLTKPTAVELGLNQGDRDALYVTNINPIVNFAPEGITIFGQKTAQRAATSLDRINVRRLMIFLRKVLLETGRQDLFEPNDAFTWELVKDKADAVLSDIQSRRGITDYRVVCDETVNTPVRVDRNELWCKILLKPTKTAEWIIFEVNLTNQSAKFSG